MLAQLRHVPARGLSRPTCWLAGSGGIVRTYGTVRTADIVAAKTPMAKKLREAKIWNPSARAARQNPGEKKDGFSLRTVEARRVNVVSEKLCDDIIQRLGPSLERHRGCDLLDVNPGTSIWSRALHDAIQPRRHIMMDPSATQYEPLRQEMMGDRNIEVIPKSGLIWPDLKEVLASYLDPDHQRPKPDEQPERNDALLVTANLTTYPKKRLWNFDNIAAMILYQMISGIRSSSLFQRYGVVRMLVWVNDDLKRTVVPRSILGRKRSAFEAELSCDWIHEVAGHDNPDATSGPYSLRDQWMQYESAANALRRMEEQGLATPPGRETSTLKTLTSDPGLLGAPLAGARPPVLQRAYMAELEQMEEAGTEGARDVKRMQQLRYRDRRMAQDGALYLELLQMHDSLLKMDPSSPDFAAADREYNERLEGVKKNMRNEFSLLRDSYQLFRHAPSQGLLWDRRAYEPLAVDTTEFYPNVPTCLLDIQPKAMDPVFRQRGPSSTRSGDYANLMLRSFYHSTTQPIHPAVMDSVWPGFAEMAREHCPSLWDPAAGGSPITGHGALTTRCMNETHWTELVKAWMRWPFRPSYLTMLGRSSDGDEVVEMQGSAQGLGN